MVPSMETFALHGDGRRSGGAKTSRLHCGVLIFRNSHGIRWPNFTFGGENRDGNFFQRARLVGKSLDGEKISSLDFVAQIHLNYLQNALLCDNTRWLEAQPSIHRLSNKNLSFVKFNICNNPQYILKKKVATLNTRVEKLGTERSEICSEGRLWISLQFWFERWDLVRKFQLFRLELNHLRLFDKFKNDSLGNDDLIMWRIWNSFQSSLKEYSSTQVKVS